MQDDDLEDEEDEYEESEDGFVVPNGYISEDEGLGSVQQSLNDLCADLEGIFDHLPVVQRPVRNDSHTPNTESNSITNLGKASCVIL